MKAGSTTMLELLHLGANPLPEEADEFVDALEEELPDEDMTW